MTKLAIRKEPLLSPGSGRLVFDQVAGRTVVVEATARSPLRLLAPSRPGVRGWAFTSTFGGGLLAGDSISHEVEARQGTTCYLSTQSSTKVYKSKDDRVSRQKTDVFVDDGALVVLCPDPLVCFEASRYEQRQRFDLARHGSLVLLDWFTSGRHASGERWKFEQFVSRNSIWIDGKRLVEDVLRLDDEAGALSQPMRMGALHCFATLVIIGERVKAFAAACHKHISQQPIAPMRHDQDVLLIGSSPLPDGVIVRLAATRTERVAHLLRSYLDFLEQLFGEHPWRRKW